MPELPELEIFRGNLQRHLCGRQVEGVAVYREKKVSASAEALGNHLIGTTLDAVERDGKEMFFRFSNGRTLGAHLMLKGAFDVVTDEAAAKYKVLTVRMAGGPVFVVADPQGLASVTLDPPRSSTPDALSPDFTPEYLQRKLRISGSSVAKAFLIDQDRVRGIGNAYSDEILWHSRISPEARVDRIPPEAVKALHSAVGTVLTEAIASIAALRPDALGGEERSFLNIHNLDRTTCPNGRPLLIKEVAKKKTFYTDEQVLY